MISLRSQLNQHPNTMLRSRIIQYCIAIILLLALPISLLSQEKESNLTLKLYTNFFYSESGSESGINPHELQKNVDFGHISPAIQIKSANGNFQEIELSRLTINHELDQSQNEILQTLEGDISNDYNLYMRYEYNYNILKKSKKYHPYIGASAQPGIGYLRTTPLISNLYKTDLFKTNLLIQVVPRLIIDLSDRFILDINLPIPLASIYWSVLNVDNPNLPIEERKTSSAGLDIIKFRDNFQFRIGLGIKL